MKKFIQVSFVIAILFITDPVFGFFNNSRCRELGYRSAVSVNLKTQCETMINGSYTIIPIDNLQDMRKKR